MVAFFVFARFFESFDGDLDADLVAEFKAVRDSFCWIEHANDCACNPMFLNSKVKRLSEHADKPLWLAKTLADCKINRIAAERRFAPMDFFTVPTITFGVLYCFFVIGHDRRRILYVNVTKHPTSGWIMQQLREVFPFEASHKYLIFDRDQKFGFEVIAAVKTTRSFPTSFRRPRQSSIAERWVGSCRRDLVDETCWTTLLR
jgi:hypothetical protein